MMLRWFKQYKAVARNAFVVALGDPVFLVVLLCVLGLQIFFASIPTFAFEQELQLIRDQSLALIFVSGCVVMTLSVVTVVVNDMRQGAISVLMSRPVSSLCVVAGKWTGLAGALLVFHVPATLSTLWITKIAGEDLAHSSSIDYLATGIYALVIVIALASMAVKHYLFGGWYVWQANLALAAAFIIGFVISNFFTPGWQFNAHWGSEVNWITGQGCLLIIFAQLIFLAALFPFAMKFEPAPVMVAALVVFFFGLLSEFLLHGLTGEGGDGGVLGQTMRSVLPNWQLYWVSDVLAENRTASISYVISSLVQVVGFVLVGIGVSTWIFNRREFSGTDVL